MAVLFEVEATCVSDEGNKEWRSVVLTQDEMKPVRIRLDVHSRADAQTLQDVHVLKHGKRYKLVVHEIDEGDRPS